MADNTTELAIAAEAYFASQADMIAKRNAKDAAIAEWREAERKCEAATRTFRQTSEDFARAMLKGMGG